MNAAENFPECQETLAPFADQIERACQRIAPTWPLDQLIAVNPWWEMRGEPMPDVAARLAALADARCLMPGAYYADLWSDGNIAAAHVSAAAAEAGVDADLDTLVGHLDRTPGLNHWHNVSDLLDSTRDQQHKMAWRDEITHQISQFCAACFKRGGPLRAPLERPGKASGDFSSDFSSDLSGDLSGDLYRHWLDVSRKDHGIAILMGEPRLPAQFAGLPDDRETLFAEAFEALGISEATAADYAHALLLDINGWASWIAYLRWRDRLAGQSNDLMRDLLAIRLAWELALWRHQEATAGNAFRRTRHLWGVQLADLPELLRVHREEQRLIWVWQRAAELAYQEPLHRELRRPRPVVPETPTLLQAAFCIDVRSEVMRRKLESRDPGIRTLGFAGFFGIPMEYLPSGTDLDRPQLPGLLKASLQARETATAERDGNVRARRLNRKARWLEAAEAPPATFSIVEAAGLVYAFRMLRMTLFPPAHRHPVNNLDPDGGTPHLELTRGDEPLTVAEKADLGAGILGAMGITSGFAPTVMLVGHGSSSSNNPQAAGLDCGACGGHTGELNVRVLAVLLNDGEVRDGLTERGIHIPAETRFVPALHDTTTDRILWLDELEPDPQIARWLDEAGAHTRRERAPRLGLGDKDDRSLLAGVERRARDWSQVRPEWGLADNASFIVAPRDHTRHIDLGGRAFLHDYRWRDDAGFSTLELIMTAPMLVTNWINLQYYASVTDNHRYGSGNKVLHNVVGGNLGVFEGNGGDLRVGLPMQSIHDGSRWMHQPLRLSVYIAAPREAIARIAASHEAVRSLVDNEWLYLFRLDDAGGIERLHHGRWLPVTDGAGS